MRFKDYGRNSKLHKAYVLQSPGLLMVGVDIGRASHSACFGTFTLDGEKSKVVKHYQMNFG